MKEKITEYPSIDKPWLKYYTDEIINASLPECSMYEYLWQNNKNHLDDISLIYFNKKISYRKLFEMIDKTANAFLSLGIKKQDTVTCLVLSQPETVYIIYALNKIGVNINLVNVLSSEKEIERSIEETNSNCIVSLNLFSYGLKNILNNSKIKYLIELNLSNSLNQIYKFLINKKAPAKKLQHKKKIQYKDFIAESNTINNTESDYIPYIITHTGGTTGTPKGVILSNNAINGLVVEYKNNLKWKRQETYMDLVVPFVIYGLCANIHMPLCLGLKTVLIPKADTNQIADFFCKYKPNHVISIPSYWQPLLESKNANNLDFSFLITAGAGGDGMTIDLENQLNAFLIKNNSNAVLLNGYGMTELCSTASTCQYNARKRGSVGIPLPHNIISAFDVETMDEKKFDEQGEICVLSPFVMEEYLNNEKETNQILKKHSDGRVWLHTGDLGHIDSDGFIFIDGRIKRIILTQLNDLGHKVFSAQIEQILSKHPLVESVCVVAKKHPSRNLVPVAFITLKDKLTTEIKNDLFDLCKNELPEYAQPYDFIFRDSLPLTPIGKIDYKALEKEAEKIYSERSKNAL